MLVEWWAELGAGHQVTLVVAGLSLFAAIGAALGYFVRRRTERSRRREDVDQRINEERLEVIKLERGEKVLGLLRAIDSSGQPEDLIAPLRAKILSDAELPLPKRVPEAAFTCVVFGTPQLVRSEGLAERISDITLKFYREFRASEEAAAQASVNISKWGIHLTQVTTTYCGWPLAAPGKACR